MGSEKTVGAGQPNRRYRPGAVVPGSAWALVTGAGTGIGRCYALRLAALGYNLVIAGIAREPLEAVKAEIVGAEETPVAEAGAAEGSNAGVAAVPSKRNAETPIDAATVARTRSEEASGCETESCSNEAAERTETGCTELPQPGKPQQVRIVTIDLARTEAAAELFAYTQAEGLGIDILINNAGIFSFCDMLTTPVERIERIILLHDLTLTKLCRLYAGEMVRRGASGHILNMSSYSLWMPFPGLSLYSASKAYVRAFSVSFAKEVREHGIRVTAVCPAGVATDLYGLTPYWQRIGVRLRVLITADSCARRGLRALWRGRRCIVPDWWNRLWIPLCKALPMCVLRPIRRFTMKFQQ